VRVRERQHGPHERAHDRRDDELRARQIRERAGGRREHERQDGEHEQRPRLAERVVIAEGIERDGAARDRCEPRQRCEREAGTDRERAPHTVHRR
jgi:hypothetical protein